MSQQIKTMYGFAVCLKSTQQYIQGKKVIKNNWWTQLYRLNPLCEILRLSKSAGSKPIAVIKIYLK